jgi:hypothetical protein
MRSRMKSELASLGGKPVRKEFLPFALPLLDEDEKREALKGWIPAGSPRAPRRSNSRRRSRRTREPPMPYLFRSIREWATGMLKT